MKIDKKLKPQLCASKDPGREVINHLYLDVENGRIISTDGRIAVVIPVLDTEGETSGLIPVDAFVAASKTLGMLKTDAESVTVVNGATTTFNRPQGQYPNIDQFTPRAKEAKYSIGINAELLVSVQRAMGAESVQLLVKNETSAILVRPQGEKLPAPNAYGIIMPVRQT